MLAAVVVASWFAQAEPAPATPAASPVTVTAPPPPSTPDNTLAVHAGWGRRLGDEARAVGPANGISIDGQYHRRYLTLDDGFELGAAVDFAYDKFQTGVTGSTMVAPGQEQAFAAQRVLSETSFALLQSVAWRHGRLRPFVEIGAGFAIAYFSTPELAFRPGSFDATQPLGRGVAGLEVAVTGDVAISLRVAYTLVFTHPTYTPEMTSYSFLGDLFDAALGVALQF